jgi:hypothetical protein
MDFTLVIDALFLPTLTGFSISGAAVANASVTFVPLILVFSIIE